jgi:hypothetical protein
VLSRGEVVGAEAGAGKVSKDATKLECTSETRRCRETGGMGGGARQGKFKTTKADLGATRRQGARTLQSLAHEPVTAFIEDVAEPQKRNRDTGP